jgi:hypothetical protein
MSAKDKAIEIFNQHIAMAASDGTAFRRTVMEQLKTETGCSHAAAATHYNNAKKLHGPIAGLGRAETPKGARRMGNKPKKEADVAPDNECFSVIELVGDDQNIVGRCQSFLYQGEAGEKYEQKVEAHPYTTWLLMQGLGPISGDTFKLQPGEIVMRKHNAIAEV